MGMAAALEGVAQRIGLELFSTPFDASAVDFLERMNVSAHKIASFENCDIALFARWRLRESRLSRPLAWLRWRRSTKWCLSMGAGGGNELALLKCTSAYPAPYEEMNLRTIPHLAQTFGVPVGLSDHTMGGVVHSGGCPGRLHH